MYKLPLIALFSFAILYNTAASQTLNDRQLPAEIDKLLSSQFKVNEPGAEITKDSIKSSIDGTTQTLYYYKSTAKKSMPLVVQLHSWSYYF